MEKLKVSDADAFYKAERKFLDGRCDLPKMLLSEGWVEAPSRFNDTKQFHRKGRVIHVTFRRDLQEYQWSEDRGGKEKKGGVLDIIGYRGQGDAKQRFYDALDDARKHVFLTRPKLTTAFYGEHPIGVEILKEIQMTDYQRVERKFLRNELSIFKVAHELDYAPSQAVRSSRTYYRKGDAALSITRKENGEYLWYDHHTGEGGFVEHLVARDVAKGSDARAVLHDMGVRLIAVDKLDGFLVANAALPLETPSLRASIEAQRELSLKTALTMLQDQYSALPVFRDWSPDHVLKEAVVRHYRIPELHPGYRASSDALGEGEAKALIRVALLREASEKIPRELVSAASETETLKPAIRSFLSVLGGMQAAEGMTVSALRNMVTEYQVEREMMRPIQVEPAKGTAHGLSF